MDYRKRIFDNYVTTRRVSMSDVEELPKLAPYFREYFTRFLPEDKNAPIFDIGCGEGTFLEWLVSLGYTNTFGIDISPEQLEIARRKGLKNIEQAEAIEYLSSHKNEFSLITSHDVIEHFPKEQVLTFLDSVYSALLQEGRVILSLPNMNSLFATRIAFGDFTHETHFTPISISQVLKATGFKVIGIFPKGPVPHGLKSYVRYGLWRIIEQFIKCYLLVETGSTYGGVYTQTLYAVGIKKI